MEENILEIVEQRENWALRPIDFGYVSYFSQRIFIIYN